VADADPIWLARQRAAILDLVRRLKNHPALLLWGLGNETGGFERPDVNPLVWRELDRLAQLIQE
jgi:beta-galactosidase/beta-glucuronidase